MVPGAGRWCGNRRESLGSGGGSGFISSVEGRRSKDELRNSGRSCLRNNLREGVRAEGQCVQRP